MFGRPAFLSPAPFATRPSLSRVSISVTRPPVLPRTRNAPARMSAVAPATARVLVAVYGVIVAGGGLAAYAKTKSTMSAGSGVVSGIVLAIAFATENLPLAFGTACALAAVFAVRYVKTKKVMPSGMLFGLSLVFAALFGTAIF